jgi:hypothetical protein
MSNKVGDPQREERSEQNQMRNIIDLLRSVMYSSDDGQDNWFDELEDLGNALSDLDGVPYDRASNRLTQALLNLKEYRPITYKGLQGLNDRKEK